MALTKLRHAGGSTIVTLPARILDLAVKDGLSPDEAIEVDYDVATRAITLKPARPRYTMTDLLAQCEPSAPLSAEDEAWFGDAPAGSEAV